MDISYILPIKWQTAGDIRELTDYLKSLSPYIELIIVDGSPETIFKVHKKAWEKIGKHIHPHPDLNCLNGKVNGVLSGLREANHESVVIADDDVRYTLGQLEQMDRLLRHAQLVVPQNYFEVSSWHGNWDTARSLLNRAVFHDYPGTLGIQRGFIHALGGYDGNVLFENLELIRTVEAGEGKILYPDSLYIRRILPTVKHFWSQRIRQAYDDHAQPFRWLFFICLLPLTIILAQRSIGFIPLIIVASIIIAEIGRRKSGGKNVFYPISSFFAPVWLMERGICSWLALGQKLYKGGCLYGNVIIPRAANPISKIRRDKKNKFPIDNNGFRYNTSQGSVG
jgi:hypothetical protein